MTTIDQYVLESDSIKAKIDVVSGHVVKGFLEAFDTIYNFVERNPEPQHVIQGVRIQATLKAMLNHYRKDSDLQEYVKAYEDKREADKKL